jgi:hypothetical protein
MSINGDEIVASEDKPSNVDGWCGRNKLSWDTDVNIQTYRLKTRTQNSHRWYFKDPEVATLFALNFS